jgi:hypothetical protein
LNYFGLASFVFLFFHARLLGCRDQSTTTSAGVKLGETRFDGGSEPEGLTPSKT